LSSSYVRTQVKTFLSANSSEDFIDLTGQYLTIKEVTSNAGLGYKDPWVGIQFVGNNEDAQTITSTNNAGRYRELGGVLLHVVARASSTVADDVLTRCETLRDLLRGRRINDVVIESVTPPNFEQGATLDLESGYISASIIVNYYRDLNL